MMTEENVMKHVRLQMLNRPDIPEARVRNPHQKPRQAERRDPIPAISLIHLTRKAQPITPTQEGPVAASTEEGGVQGQLKQLQQTAQQLRPHSIATNVPKLFGSGLNLVVIFCGCMNEKSHSVVRTVKNVLPLLLTGSGMSR